MIAPKGDAESECEAKPAKSNRLLAVTTLVRRLPEPVYKISGTLVDTERVLVCPDWRPRRSEQADTRIGRLHLRGVLERALDVRQEEHDPSA